MKQPRDLPFALLWVGVVFVTALAIIRFSPVWTGADARLPLPHAPTDSMKVWLGDAVPSSKLRMHRE